MDFANAFHVVRELGRTDDGRAAAAGGADRDPLEPPHVRARRGRGGRLGRAASLQAFARRSGVLIGALLLAAVLPRRRQRRVQPAARARRRAQRRRGALLAALVVLNFFAFAACVLPGEHTSSLRRASRSACAPSIALTKPRVVSLIVFTAVIGMFLATPGMVPPRDRCSPATLGIALVAGAAAAVNCLVEQKIDAVMARTRWRPLPQRRAVARRRPWCSPACWAALGLWLLLPLRQRAHHVAHARHLRRLRDRSTP